nr:hypothetical protein CDS [Bradyrhizobium sp.]
MLARFQGDPGSNESAEIQALLAKIETALKLGTQDPAAAARTASPGEQRIEGLELHRRLHLAAIPDLADEGPSSGGL